MHLELIRDPRSSRPALLPSGLHHDLLQPPPGPPPTFKPTHNWPPDVRKMWDGDGGMVGGSLEVTALDRRGCRRTFQSDCSRGHMAAVPCDVCYERRRRRRRTTGWRVNQNIWSCCVQPSSQTSQSIWFTTGLGLSSTASFICLFFNDASLFLIYLSVKQSIYDAKAERKGHLMRIMMIIAYNLQFGLQKTHQGFCTLKPLLIYTENYCNHCKF